MEMTYTNCWDCPLTIAGLAAQISLLAVAGFIAVWLLRRRVAVAQAAGAVSLVVVSFLVVTLPVYVPRWGVWKIGSERELYSPVFVRIALVILAASFFVVVVSRLRARASSAV